MQAPYKKIVIIKFLQGFKSNIRFRNEVNLFETVHCSELSKAIGIHHENTPNNT